MPSLRSLAAFGAVAVLLACSPAQEWRTLPLPALGLQVSLPCKPDRAERRVELAGTELPMLMQGCDADGNTYAVACATLEHPERAGMALTHWRAAVLAAAQARDTQDLHFQPAGALGLPQSLRTSAAAVMPGGSAMRLEAAWFARVQGADVRACHVNAYGPELTSAMADVFFNGVTLQ